jgi:hypothetical protein
MTGLAAAATVADALRSPTARDAALDALEALPRPIADDVALAAAPALVDVVAGGLWRFPLGVAMCPFRLTGVGTALGFCLENSLEIAEEFGLTTSTAAAKICCSIFGRDEGGSGFTFTQQHVDLLITHWSMQVRPVLEYHANVKPSADAIFAMQLCVSDTNKPLLLANKDFIPYLPGQVRYVVSGMKP